MTPRKHPKLAKGILEWQVGLNPGKGDSSFLLFIFLYYLNFCDNAVFMY